MTKRNDRITKHLSKLQDKLENGKLSPKKIGKVRRNLDSWRGVLDTMAADIDKAYPQQPTSPVGVTPGTHG